MPKTDLQRIKDQLEDSSLLYQLRFKVTMENANLLESQIKAAEEALLRFRGINEGVTIFKKALHQRLQSYANAQDPNPTAVEELRNIIKMAENLENQAATQSVRQEGAIQAVKNTVESLKNNAEESARMARTKDAQLSKADKSSMGTPQQEPPKASGKKKAKKAGKKVAKKTTKKAAKKKAKKTKKSSK